MSLGPSFPIVIQSGLSAGTPSTVGNLPQFSGIAPPNILINSLLRQVTPAAIIVGATDPSAAATETLRTQGGLISSGAAPDSFIAGRAASAGLLSVGSVVIGQGASLGAVGVTNLNDSMIIGTSSSMITGQLAFGATLASVVLGPRNTVSTLQTGGFANPENWVVLGSRNVFTNTLGGFYSNVIAIGSGITGVATSTAIIIGVTGATLPTQYTGIMIGHSISTVGNAGTFLGNGIACGTGNDNTIIGRGAAKTGASGQENIIIGVIATIAATDFAIVIGSTAQIAAGATGTIAIGRQSNIQFQNCLAIAPGATPSAANQCVLGSNFTGGDYREFVFGQGPDQLTGAIVTKWRPSNGTGANIAIGDLQIAAGMPTGNAVGGNFVVQTGVLGGAGSVVQTPAARITALGGVAATQVFIGGDPGGTDTLRVGGSLTINTALQLLSNKTAFTNNAGVAAGTLLNAPAAGNPTKWIRIDDNGTARFIPCW